MKDKSSSGTSSILKLESSVVQQFSSRKGVPLPGVSELSKIEIDKDSAPCWDRKVIKIPLQDHYQQQLYEVTVAYLIFSKY